jgi:hypothetical protein
MKPYSLPQVLHHGCIGPASAAPLLANDMARLLAMQLEIQGGRYAADCRVVAAGMLSAIAPARRH